MITVIFGDCGSGKTVLLTHFIRQRAFDYERNCSMRYEIMRRIQGGYDLQIPQYSVATNYDVVCRKAGYSPRPSIVINPYRLGFYNEDVNTHFLPPYTTIGIQEGQKYFNSRMFKFYPTWQSRFFEAHRHNHFDVFIDVQRPNLIDVNIRELSNFIEIVGFEQTKNGLRWLVRQIANSFLLDLYNASGRRDKSLYTECVITADYDVFKLYDSRNLKPRFYDGRDGQAFDVPNAQLLCGNKDDFNYYNKLYGEELPDKFYKKQV